MKHIISPKSKTPIWLKAIIRLCIVKYTTQILNRKFALHEYGDECNVSGWYGWLEWHGIPICFVDTDSGDHYRW